MTTVIPFHEIRKPYSPGATSVSRNRPAASVTEGGDQPTSFSRGKPHTVTPAAGCPSRSRTRPSTIAGSRKPDEPAASANPEELLLAAVAACFVNTWAIFLKKLQVAYPEPAIRLDGSLGKDPAGGYRMTGAVIHALVPASLLEKDRARVEKTLQLSEKYCIITKVARAAMPVRVEIEAV